MSNKREIHDLLEFDSPATYLLSLEEDPDYFIENYCDHDILVNDYPLLAEKIQTYKNLFDDIVEELTNLADYEYDDE